MTQANISIVALIKSTFVGKRCREASRSQHKFIGLCSLMNGSRYLVSAFALLVSLFASASTYAVISDFAHYDVYFGDVDGIEGDDLYFRGKDIFVLLHGEIATPIIVDVESFYFAGELACIDVSPPQGGTSCVEYLTLSSSASAIDDFSDDDIALFGLEPLVEGTDYHIGDFDGDGKQDFVLSTDDARFELLDINPYTSRTFFVAGASDVANITQIETDYIENFALYSVSDVDGDGRDNLVIMGDALYADEILTFDTNSEAFTHDYYYENDVIKTPSLHGASTGSFRVDESGAATYSIPLALPAGTAGVAPSLALNFSSQGGNGLLGKGWSLSGLSAITRCRKTLIQDGKAEPLDMIWGDTFCLNGQRLYVVGDTSGAIEYKTEIDNFSRILGYGGTKPRYFTVEAKDGSISYFGHYDGVDDSSNPIQKTSDGSDYSFALAKFEDSVGNKVLYNYLQDDGSDYRIDKIHYAFGAIGNTSPNAEVSFEYSDRPDPAYRYIAGSAFNTTKRLESIVVKNQEPASTVSGLQEIRTYNLSYGRHSPDVWLKNSFIEAVQECVGDKCLPATEFNWTKEGGLEFSAPVISDGIMLYDSTLVQLTPFDINGDGYLDLAWLMTHEADSETLLKLQYAKYDPTTMLYSTGTFIDNQGGVDCTDNTNKDTQEGFCENGAEFHNAVTITPMDFNGDGRQDLAIFRDTNNQHKIYLSAIDSTGDASLLGAPIILEGLNDKNFTYMDADSDGMLDIITNNNIWYLRRNSEPATSSQAYSYVKDEVAISFSGFTQPFEDVHPDSGYELYSDDLAGLIKGYSTSFYEKDFAQAGDFNGDGQADLIVTDRRVVSRKMGLWLRRHVYQEDNYYIAIREGNSIVATKFLGKQIIDDEIGVTAESKTSATIKFSSVGQFWTQDINGDSYSDILMLINNQTGDDTYQVYLNTGAGFTDPKTVLTVDDSKDYDVQLNDLNADGYADLQVRTKSSGTVNYYVWLPDLATFSTLKTFVAYVGVVDKNKDRIMIYDATGDGQPDLIHFQDQDVHLQPNAHTEFPGQVTSITNGLGATTNIEYELLTTTSHYAGLLDSTAYETVVPATDYCNPYDIFDFGVCGLPGYTKNTVDPTAFYQLLNDPCSNVVDTESFAHTNVHPVLEYRAPMPIVTRIDASAPAAGTAPGTVDYTAQSSIEYFYEHALIQAAGRGFLGFKKLSTFDAQTGVMSSTSYRQDWPFIGYPNVTEQKAPSGGVMSRTVNTYGLQGWQASWPDTLAGSATGTKVLGVLRPHLKLAEETSYVITSDPADPSHVLVSTNVLQTKTTENSYDNVGNVMGVSTITEGAGLSLEQEIVNTYASGDITFNNRANALSAAALGRLESTTVTTTRNSGTPSVRTSNFEYYLAGSEAGLLKTEVLNPDTEAEISTAYTYNAFGSQVTAAATGINQYYNENGDLNGVGSALQTRVARSEYDTTGRYVDRSYSDFGTESYLTQSVTGRSIFGSPTQIESDLNNTVATIEYDVLGREIERSDNIGAWASTTYNNCSSITCPPGAVYSITKDVAGGGQSKSYVDVLGRTIRTASKTFDGTLSCVDQEFDTIGRAVRASEPFFCSAGAEYWSENTYDMLGRVVSTTTPNENGTATQSNFYDGYITTITNPLGQVKTETKNGLGELVSVEDELGGVINYRYDSHGNLEYIDSIATPADLLFGAPATVTTHIGYDSFNRKVVMEDPDKGAWQYKYNAFGELVWQQDGKGQVVTQGYDTLGRMERRIDYTSAAQIAQHTRWYYGLNTDAGESTNVGMGVSAVIMSTSASNPTCASADSVQCNYPIYDQYGRAEANETLFRIDGTLESYITRTEFNAIGQVEKQFDVLDGDMGLGLMSTKTTDARYGDNSINSGTQNFYNDHGYLDYVKDLQTGVTVYDVESTNARNQAQSVIRGNGITSENYYFDETGQIERQSATFASAYNIQSLHYTWDKIGNLTSRRNAGAEPVNADSGLKESFCYDGLNRLIKTNAATDSDAACNSLSQTEQDLTYDSRGNIRSKAGMGTYSYDGAGPHAVSDVGGRQYHYDSNGNIEYDVDNAGLRRDFTYSTFDKPTLITKQFAGGGEHTTEFAYGMDRSRYLRKDLDKNGEETVTRYLGGVEKITKSSEPNKIEWKRYLGKTTIVTITTDNNNAILTDGTGHKARYIYNDHLGSVDVITDEVGTVVTSMSFNPWGERRNVNTWDDYALAEFLETSEFASLKAETTRGFTGHEMVDEVGLIHMNGRIYDATIARFLQADPFIQAATNTQSYNRYSYTFNNPLNATDPSGYLSNVGKRVFRQAVGVVIAVVVSIGCAGTCGPAVWAMVGAAGAIINGAGGRGIAIAALSGAVGAYFGQVAGLGRVARSVALGVTGGVTSVLQGGKFGHGFVASFASSLAGNPKFNTGNAGLNVLKDAVVGGTISDATGGKFANGAKTTAFLMTMRSLPGLYKKVTGYDLDMRPGGAAVQKTELSSPAEGANNIGVQGGNVANPCAACEGGGLSNALNQVPGVNAVAGVHDVMQVSLGAGLARDILNVPGMIPAAAFTYTAALSQPLTHLNTGQIISIATTYSRNKERDRDRQLPYVVGF